jgi:type I restriction enzyme, S subunit
MVCIGATIGKCGYCDHDVTTNQQINSLTPVDGVSHKFVYYQMLTENFQRRVVLSSGQATLPIINKSKWSRLTLALPPDFAEQRRIVSILDEAFDGIATAKANAEKNLQNARVLFESHLQAVFTQRGEGWVEKKLSEVCAITSTLVAPRKD